MEGWRVEGGGWRVEGGGWRGGGVEGWRGGGVEGWRGGEVERWRGGGVEGIEKCRDREKRGGIIRVVEGEKRQGEF